MSRFLGPIHHWLFNKIVLHERLKKELILLYKDQYGSEIENIVTEMKNCYGLSIENNPLDQLIDTNNIHGWLQERISIAETRQAAILTQIFNRYGKEAVEIAIGAYGNQGARCGVEAQTKDQVDSGPSIYKSMNNYMLGGMPCDNVNNITSAYCNGKPPDACIGDTVRQ